MVKFILNYYLINYIWCLNMINFFIKGAIKRAALKLATDKKKPSKQELSEIEKMKKDIFRIENNLRGINKNMETLLKKL